jgi:hypothetical protein
VCNQVRTFDSEAREKSGSARYIETLDAITAEEIVTRVVSVIDPAPFSAEAVSSPDNRRIDSHCSFQMESGRTRISHLQQIIVSQ